MEVNPMAATLAATVFEELPLEEQIRRRAYQLYVERGNESGSETDDWLQAQDEVLAAQEAAHA